MRVRRTFRKHFVVQLQIRVNAMEQTSEQLVVVQEVALCRFWFFSHLSTPRTQSRAAAEDSED